MALHIAHFIDTKNKGGAEVTLMDLAIHQRQSGIEVTVFQNNNDFIIDLCMENDISVESIPAHNYYKKTYTLPLFAIALAYKLINKKIDVLHSHLFGPITGNSLAAFTARVRHIGTLHDIYMLEEKASRIKLLSLSNKLGTKLVSVSKDMSDFYVKCLHLDKAEMTTIYNASIIETKPSPFTKKNIFDQYSLSDDDIIITTVGRLVTLKRVDWIINAFSNIDNIANKNVKLIIIGDGPEYANLSALTKKNNLHNIIFTGEIQNVNELLYLSDIYVQFSNTEGLSRSIIEALSCQLPCIVSDVGGNRELVLNNINGYLLNASDLDSLTEALTRLLVNDEKRTFFGELSFAHFNKHFNFDKFQTSYLSLYKG